MVLASFSSFISQIWKYLLLQLLGLVAAETIGEGEADDSAKVHFVDDVLTSVGVVQMVVAFLSINKRIECFFEVFVEPLGWVICYLMLA